MVTIDRIKTRINLNTIRNTWTSYYNFIGTMDDEWICLTVSPLDHSSMQKSIFCCANLRRQAFPVTQLIRIDGTVHSSAVVFE